jgi:uncharacterized protein (DUF433 family)
MATFDRVKRTPAILVARATIGDLRISVARVVNLVANGMTPVQIIEEVPGLDEEDTCQALAFGLLPTSA